MKSQNQIQSNGVNMQKTVVLGVTGGIAAYKALDIVSRLKKKNINVHVIMTESAAKFVTPLSFQSLSQNYVVSDMFGEPKSFEIEHISLAEKADVFLIAPATADIIGKIANGIADDMLSTTVMATKAKVIIAPAMNSNMYSNPIVQNNIMKLKQYGYDFIEPEEGRLACGTVGKGKLASPSVIVDRVEKILYQNRDLDNMKILITAGPTREDIDPVRYITNRSSGKMGYAIAIAAKDRGADVTLITGPTSIEQIPSVNTIDIYSADEMYEKVKSIYKNYDAIIMAAAVADFKPINKSDKKIKKSNDNISIELTRTHDILYEIGKNKENKIIIGFAAETNDVLENAKAKIKKKNLDMIVANDVTQAGAGFQNDTNKVSFIGNDGSVKNLPVMSKYDVAMNILDYVKSIKR